MNLRAIYYTRVFSKKLRTIMAVIDSSIWELSSFMMMLYFFIFMMAVSMYALEQNEYIFNKELRR